jgi:hypothetical protein
MANRDANIAQAFIKGEPIKRSWISRTRSRGGPWGGGAPTHNFWAKDGTARLSVIDNRLVSYERWNVAVRLEDGTVILNGDVGPTMMTKGHQREAREACKALNVKHAFLPFSALFAAGIRDVSQISIVATTADKTIKIKHVGRLPTGERYEFDGEDHFLGEVLFTYAGRYYVSGLDRNDAPQRRKFYLARLPENRKPKTVDAALDALRPRGVPADALRQGEWFLVPSDKRPKAKDVVRSHVKFWEKSTAPGVPILSAKPDDMQAAIEHPRQFEGRHGRHRASRMYLNGAVYVAGVLRDEEHGPLKLGDGRTWYRVVRNTADGSWGATGDVD